MAQTEKGKGQRSAKASTTTALTKRKATQGLKTSSGRAGPGAKLPAALAKNAAAKAEARRAELAAAARDDIEQIKRRQREIVESFYEIGEALRRLQEEGRAQALGYKGFTEMLAKELAMGLSTAERLIAIVTHVAREDALRWGQEKSAALAALAVATTDPKDSPASLAKARLKLPSGRTLHIEKASTTEVLEAAKEHRQARAAANAGSVRGRTTTPEERAQAAAIEAELHTRGVSQARVRAMATKPGGVANLRIEGVPMNAIAALRAALTKTGR